MTAPGVGFHLTPSYAVAAVRYHNGTVMDVAKVEASIDYKKLIVRLSDASLMQNFASSSVGDILKYSLAQARRQWNMARGFAASRDAEILASLLRDTKSAVEVELGSGTADMILPVFPSLPGLDQQLVADAMHYAGLEWAAANRSSRPMMSETSAAYAGIGHGLCVHYNDLEQCIREEKDMRLTRVLALSFSESSFGVVLQNMRSAYSDVPEAEFLRLDLGRSQVPSMGAARTEFWQNVQEQIEDIASSLPRGPSRILLFGEYANDSEFLEAVKAAVWETSQMDASILLHRNDGEEDTTYIAARGAAELARRAQRVLSRRHEIPNTKANANEEQHVFSGELR